MSFVKVYFDFEERTEMLNEVEQGRLLLTMLRYAQGKTLPELKGNERFLFPVFKADIDRDAATYCAKVNNGAKGGRPKQEPKITEENLTEPNVTEDNLNAKNKNKNKTKNKSKNRTEEEEQILVSFPEFWSIYPNKVKKQLAENAWIKLAPDESLVKVIVEDVKQRAKTEWTGEGEAYVPHPTTYLNQRRWEDETRPRERKQSFGAAPPVNPSLDYDQRKTDDGYYDHVFDDFYGSGDGG